MPMLASDHAAFETGCQIGVVNFLEDFDDLLLDYVREFHFALGRHAAIYVTWRNEPEFLGNGASALDR